MDADWRRSRHGVNPGEIYQMEESFQAGREISGDGRRRRGDVARQPVFLLKTGFLMELSINLWKKIGKARLNINGRTRIRVNHPSITDDMIFIKSRISDLRHPASAAAILAAVPLSLSFLIHPSIHPPVPRLSLLVTNRRFQPILCYIGSVVLYCMRGIGSLAGARSNLINARSEMQIYDQSCFLFEKSVELEQLYGQFRRNVGARCMERDIQHGGFVLRRI